MKSLLSTVAAAALFGAGALAQSDRGQMNDTTIWDADQDSQISRDEFQAGADEEWRRHGINQGAGMTEQEYGQTGLGDDESFAEYDSVRNRTLSSDEYSEGVFDQFDENDDDMWDEDETAAYDEWRGTGQQTQSN